MNPQDLLLMLSLLQLPPDTLRPVRPMYRRPAPDEPTHRLRCGGPQGVGALQRPSWLPCELEPRGRPR
jgi:hypothetical protein